jgi:hypothetical protein
VPTIGRGSARPRGWWWRESKKSNMTSKPPGIYENGQFPAFIDLKNAKTLLFTYKYLSPKTFFEGYIILKFCIT